MEALDPVAGTAAPGGFPSPAPVGSGPSRRLYSAPLVIGVTGHRDLVPAEIPVIRERVRAFFSGLHSQYPDRDLLLLSPLAEGADRLVSEEVLALGLPVTVLLPMPRELYVEDFESDGSRAEFDRLCAAATDLFELPLTPGNMPVSVEGQGPNRSRQYAQASVFLSAHCHILLALWDGKGSSRIGGTAQVVRFHQDDVMPGFAPRAAASRLTLVDDESDLVYPRRLLARPPRRRSRPRAHAARLRLVHARRPLRGTGVTSSERSSCAQRAWPCERSSAHYTAARSGLRFAAPTVTTYNSRPVRV